MQQMVDVVQIQDSLSLSMSKQHLIGCLARSTMKLQLFRDSVLSFALHLAPKPYFLFMSGIGGEEDSSSSTYTGKTPEQQHKLYSFTTS